VATDNVLWGAERIRGELPKLGIRVSKRTIQKYMRQVRPPGKRGQNWFAFLRNHSRGVWACDFLQHYDVLFRLIFAFFIVVHGTREVVHFNVTRHPTDACTAQQLRQATPFGEAPAYLIGDNDSKFGRAFAAVAEGTGITVMKIPPRSPSLNSVCERSLGSVRRECLDHVVVLGERHLRNVLGEYVEAYFNVARPHQGLAQKIPRANARGPATTADGDVVATPILGGLHRDCRLAA
jgi:transposase InsO family protein